MTSLPRVYSIKNATQISNSALHTCRAAQQSKTRSAQVIQTNTEMHIKKYVRINALSSVVQLLNELSKCMRAHFRGYQSKNL